MHSKARSRLSLTHLPVQPLSRIKSLDDPRVRVISPVVEEKVYGVKIKSGQTNKMDYTCIWCYTGLAVHDVMIMAYFCCYRRIDRQLRLGKLI